jgi:hypothetical protein
MPSKNQKYLAGGFKKKDSSPDKIIVQDSQGGEFQRSNYKEDSKLYIQD